MQTQTQTIIKLELELEKLGSLGKSVKRENSKLLYDYKVTNNKFKTYISSNENIFTIDIYTHDKYLYHTFTSLSPSLPSTLNNIYEQYNTDIS